MFLICNCNYCINGFVGVQSGKAEKRNSQYEHGQPMEQTKNLFCTCDSGVARCQSQRQCDFLRMNSMFEVLLGNLKLITFCHMKQLTPISKNEHFFTYSQIDRIAFLLKLLSKCCVFKVRHVTQCFVLVMEYIRGSGAPESIFHNKHKTLYNLFSPDPAVSCVGFTS